MLPLAMVVFPEPSTVNLAVPLCEALINGPPPVWLIVKADCPLEVAKIENKPSTSTDPTALGILLLFDVLINGLLKAILPNPSAESVTLPLEPVLVVSNKGCPDIVNWPPLAWKIGFALPPIVKFPEESKAKTTFDVPAPDWVIGAKPCKVSELAAKATVASCCRGVISGVVFTLTPKNKAEFVAKSQLGIPQGPVGLVWPTGQSPALPSNTEKIPS